jgi:hypothetical protein
MPSFYAIRWDVGAYDTTPASVAELNTLRQPEFHNRAPFFATVQETNSLAVTATQATMNQEIAFALAGGLTGWAYLRYDNITSPVLGGTALSLFVSSTSKGALKFVSIEQNGTLGTSATYTGLVNRLRNEMGQAWYGTVTVAGTVRPLMFYLYDAGTLAANYTNDAGLKTVLDFLRAQCIAIGLNTPYIVAMFIDGRTAAAAQATATAIGADAITTYLPIRPYNLDGAYSDLRTAALGEWAAYAAAGKMIPTCTTGWNPAPRLQMPVPWEAGSADRPQRSWVGHRKVFALPTDAQLGAHIGEATTFIAANASACESGVALVYAWNEHGENGRPVCPDRGNPTGTWLDDMAAAV